MPLYAVAADSLNWQAVVNEDMEGNVAVLNAENARLREEVERLRVEMVAAKVQPALLQACTSCWLHPAPQRAHAGEQVLNRPAHPECWPLDFANTASATGAWPDLHDTRIIAAAHAAPQGADPCALGRELCWRARHWAGQVSHLCGCRALPVAPPSLAPPALAR